MEIIFLIISIIITLGHIYTIGRVLFTHEELMSFYKTNEFIGIAHLFLGMLMMIVVFYTLCAINNTFWQLPYVII